MMSWCGMLLASATAEIVEQVSVLACPPAGLVISELVVLAMCIARPTIVDLPEHLPRRRRKCQPSGLGLLRPLSPLVLSSGLVYPVFTYLAFT